jgi:hypothetical protein
MDSSVRIVVLDHVLDMKALEDYRAETVNEHSA